MNIKRCKKTVDLILNRFQCFLFNISKSNSKITVFDKLGNKIQDFRSWLNWGSAGYDK